MNMLKAVFWDYPDFTNSEKLRILIKDNRNRDIYLWVLYRFLEYGRAIDTFKYFKISEISKDIDKLKLRPYTRKKWNRLIEVYGKIEGE